MTAHLHECNGDLEHAPSCMPDDGQAPREPAQTARRVADGLLIRGHVSREIHCVMQDANHLNGGTSGGAVENKVPTTAAFPGNMQRTKPRLDLVADHTTWNIGTVVQGGQRRNERATIDACLPSPEVLCGPIEDSQKIVLGRFRQSDAPALPGQPYMCARSAISLRYCSSVAESENSRKAPSSRAVIPTSAAVRSAASLAASSASRR